MVKHYIKLGLWIFILSVLYAAGASEFFGFCAKLPIIFSLVYGMFARTFKEKLTVSCICGVFVSALGGDSFVPAVLCVVYGTLIVSAMFSGKFLKYRYLSVVPVSLIIFLYEIILGTLALGVEFSVIKGSIISTVVSLCFAVVLYPLIKNSFKLKERYIF